MPLVLGAPEPNKILQVGTHESRIKGEKIIQGPSSLVMTLSCLCGKLCTPKVSPFKHMFLVLHTAFCFNTAVLILDIK